jgi:hypothetical protein
MRNRPPRSTQLPIPTMKAYMDNAMKQGQDDMFNRRAHDQMHGPTTLIYQTATALTTDVGPPLRLPRGGVVTRISCKLAGAPSGSAFQVNVLIDGITVFPSGEYLEVAVGDTVSKFKIVERPNFNEDSVFTVDIQTISSATGPMVMTIEYLPEY